MAIPTPSNQSSTEPADSGYNTERIERLFNVIIKLKLSKYYPLLLEFAAKSDDVLSMWNMRIGVINKLLDKFSYSGDFSESLCGADFASISSPILDHVVMKYGETNDVVKLWSDTQPHVFCRYFRNINNVKIVTVESHLCKDPIRQYKIGSTDSLRRRLTEYLSSRTCFCSGIDSEFIEQYVAIHVKYPGEVVKYGHAMYHRKCAVIGHSKERRRCQQCASANRKYRRNLSSAQPLQQAPKKTTEMTRPQLLEKIDQMRSEVDELKLLCKNMEKSVKILHKHARIIQILENKSEMDDLDSLISYIVQKYAIIDAYIQQHNSNAILFVRDQFSYIVHKQLDTLNGMRWHKPSVIVAMYLRVRLSIYNMFAENQTVFFPSLRTLDDQRQQWVVADGMNNKLIALFQRELQKYYRDRQLTHPPFLGMQVDEMYVQELLWFNPSNAEIKGQRARIHEESCLRSLINLLSNNDGLRPSHIMLQINFIDLRSGFYFEGPTYGSETGWQGTELYKIIVGDVMKKLWKAVPEWNLRATFLDCAQSNASFVGHAMGLSDSKLCDNKILSFTNPFHQTPTYVVWCGDHTAKNVRNQIASKMLEHGEDVVNWNYLRRMQKLCETDLLQENFATCKRLKKRAVDLKNFDKMRVSYLLDVTSDDTLSVLKNLIRTDENFRGAQPLYDALYNLGGIFNGIVIGPRIHPENQRIYDETDPVFAKQLQHLKYFEDGKALSGDKWLPVVTQSHLEQHVYTGQALAKELLQENVRLGVKDKYVSFFKYSNRKLESSNGVVRGLGYHNSAFYPLAKGLQRFTAHSKYENQGKNQKITYEKLKVYHLTKDKR